MTKNMLIFPDTTKKKKFNKQLQRVKSPNTHIPFSLLLLYPAKTSTQLQTPKRLPLRFLLLAEAAICKGNSTCQINQIEENKQGTCDPGS